MPANSYYDSTGWPPSGTRTRVSSATLRSEFDLVEAGFTALENDLDALAVDNDDAKGAALIGYQGKTLADWLALLPNIVTAGADPTGVADSASAIIAAIAAYDFFIIPYGTYKITEEIPIVKDYQYILSLNATFAPTHDGTAVSVKAAAGALVRDVKIMGMLYVSWSAADWTKDRRAFHIQNSFHGEYHISWVRATVGLYLNADAYGCVDNQFNFGIASQTIASVRIARSSGGYVNANTFKGGRFNGTGDPSGSLYPSEAGHIYVGDDCIGNDFDGMSLEWIGTGSSDFKAIRSVGDQNRFRPGYVELRDTLYVWCVDTGTSNKFDGDVPFLTGYNPADPTNCRIDASGATNHKSDANTYGYEFIIGGPKRLVNSSSTFPPLRLTNNNTGPALMLENTASNDVAFLQMLLTNGNVGVSITPNGDYWQVKANTTGTVMKKVYWNVTAAPTTGTHKAGDIAFYSDPAGKGYLLTVCSVGGSPGTWVNRVSMA